MPGRFTSVFLASFGLSPVQVGIVLSVPILLSLVSSTAGSIVADKMSNGKARVILACNILSSAAFQLLAVPVGTSNTHRFVYSAVIFGLSDFTLKPVFPVMDAYTLEFLEKTGGNKKNYGKERLWGAVSWAVAHLALGASLDQVGFPLVYLGNVVATVLLAVLITSGYTCGAHPPCTTAPQKQNENAESGARVEEQKENLPQSAVPQVEQSQNHETTTQDDENKFLGDDEEAIFLESSTGTLGEPAQKMGVLNLYRWILTDVPSVAFLITMACINVGTSVVENLIFLMFYKDLKASSFLCGVTVVITVLFEIPLFAASDYIHNVLGCTSMMVVGMLCHVIRVMFYSVLDPEHSWFLLIVEPLHGVTFALVRMASVQEMSNIAPPHLQATAQSIVGGCSVIGNVIGTFGGGFVLENYGSVTVYRGLATLVTSAAALYALTRFSYREEIGARAASLEHTAVG